jgi:hypothetical protein
MTRAISVKAYDNKSILVTLDDGRILLHEMSDIENKSGPVIQSLKNDEEFKKVFISNGIVTWPSGYDIDPEYLIESSQLVSNVG